MPPIPETPVQVRAWKPAQKEEQEVNSHTSIVPQWLETEVPKSCQDTELALSWIDIRQDL